MSIGSLSSRSQPTRAWGSVYEHFFGAATWPQVAGRLAVDSFHANVSALAAAVISLFYVGEITTASRFGEICSAVVTEYRSAAPLFTALVLGLFCLVRMYRPLPAGRWQRRVAYIAAACGAGILAHIGSTALFHGDLTRSHILPAWGMMFAFAVATRLSRNFFALRFQVTPRSKSMQSRVEHVLVVGGSGYIGSVLTRLLLKSGYQVRVLDLHMFGTEALDEISEHPALEIMEGDFRNVEDVVRALRGMDAVIHLAAIVGDPACAVDAETTIAVNYEAAKMMATLSRANGISRFLFASTCSVYGATDDVIDEQSELNPVSLYATTKIDAERALLDAADDVFQPTILRLATAYGWSHRPRFDLVANLMSAKAVTDREITVFNGEQWRPFVNTRDIARAFLTALEAPLGKVGAEIFNVGDNSQNYTISQLGQIVGACVPGTVVLEKRNNEDPRNYRVRFDKIQKTLGFKAAVSLEDGIREIVEAVQSGKVEDWKDPIYSNVKKMHDSVLPILKFQPAERARRSQERELQATRQFLRRAA